MRLYGFLLLGAYQVILMCGRYAPQALVGSQVDSNRLYTRSQSVAKAFAANSRLAACQRSSNWPRGSSLR